MVDLKRLIPRHAFRASRQVSKIRLYEPSWRHLVAHFAGLALQLHARFYVSFACGGLVRTSPA